MPKSSDTEKRKLPNLPTDKSKSPDLLDNGERALRLLEQRAKKRSEQKSVDLLDQEDSHLELLERRAKKRSQQKPESTTK